MIRIVSGKKTTWYAVDQPSLDDITALRNAVPAHPLILDELIPQIRHPKLDLFSAHFFLVLTIPILERATENNGTDVHLEELDFIVGDSWIVTSHYRPMGAVDDLFARVQQDEKTRAEFLDENPAILLYAILSTILRNSIASLDTIERNVEAIEHSTFAAPDYAHVRTLSELRRSIIDFRLALSPSRPVFRALDDTGPALLGASSLPYFRNLTGRIEQIATLLSTLKETVEALEETNQALLTTHTNDIIRTLTVFTAILLPLTLLASIFGMNVPFPFAQHPFSFWFLLTMMVGILCSLLLFFRNRRWI